MELAGGFGMFEVRPLLSYPLGVNLAGSPQYDYEGQGANTRGQESLKHGRPPLVENADQAMVLFRCSSGMVGGLGSRFLEVLAAC
jgi:hypothetical protein